MNASGFEALGPGSALPGWMEALEVRCFDESWHRLGDLEWALLAPPGGFATWSVLPAVGEAELLRVAVDPAARREGLGRRLLRESEARLRGQGIRTLLLEVRLSNAAARALYEAEGWRRDGLRKGYYKDGEDAALYRKELG